MSKAQINKKPDGTIEIKLSLPWSDVQTAYDKQVQLSVDQAELPGFRKGKAPKNLVEPKLDKSHLYSHAVQELLPKVYAQVVKESHLEPILYPQIQITSGQENQDWEFIATTCEAPVVTLKDYLPVLKKLPAKPAEDLLQRRIAKLHELASFTLPAMLIAEEVNHRISSLAENLSRLGLTTENYLQSKKLTADSLKNQLTTEAEHDLKSEFILLHLQKEHQLKDRKATLDFLTNLI